MKIGFDAKRAFFNHSGLGNYSRNLILSLKKTFPKNDYFLYSAKSGGNYMNEFSNSSFSLINTNSAMYKMLPSYWRRFIIPSIAQKNGIDIYHGLSHELPVGIEKTGIKTVVTIHDLIFERFPHHYSFIDVIGYRRKIKHACKMADAVVAISEQTKQDLIQFYQADASKISVIYQGCDALFGKATNIDYEQTVTKKYHLPNEFILHVGGFTERKNHIKLLQAFNLIKHKTNASIVFVGNGGSEEKKIRTYIQEKNLTDSVLFITAINTLDLSYVYQKAKLLVYNSLFEGFGIPILEAFASKIPVLTSTGSCFYEVGNDACLYSNYDDEQSLSGNILTILTDDNIRNQLINKGTERLELFDNHKIANDYIELYSNVLK